MRSITAITKVPSGDRGDSEPEFCGHKVSNSRRRNKVFGDVVSLFDTGFFAGPDLRNFPAHNAEQAFFFRVENPGSRVTSSCDIANDGTEPPDARRKPYRGQYL